MKIENYGLKVLRKCAILVSSESEYALALNFIKILANQVPLEFKIVAFSSQDSGHENKKTSLNFRAILSRIRSSLLLTFWKVNFSIQRKKITISENFEDKSSLDLVTHSEFTLSTSEQLEFKLVTPLGFAELKEQLDGQDFLLAIGEFEYVLLKQFAGDKEIFWIPELCLISPSILNFGIRNVLNKLDLSTTHLREIQSEGLKYREIDTFYTRTGIIQNQAQVIASQLHMLIKQLRFAENSFTNDLKDLESFVTEVEVETYSLSALILGTFTKTISQLSRKFIGFFGVYRKKWNVAYFEVHEAKYQATNFIKIRNERSSYNADPFIFNSNGQTYCFVEEFDLRKRKGHISAYEILGSEYVRIGKVLEEDFHLSFPFVFEFDGDIYMTPESSENFEIRLYKARDFPFNWDLNRVLISNIKAVDPILFYSTNRGCWWLICNVSSQFEENYSRGISIFSAKDFLRDDFIEHIKSPITFHPNVSRNGGFLANKPFPIRVSQESKFDQYGTSVSLHQIYQLDEFNYQETTIKEIHSIGAFKPEGMHHISSDGKYFAVDYRTTFFRFIFNYLKIGFDRRFNNYLKLYEQLHLHVLKKKP